jgi:hypothetical protein
MRVGASHLNLQISDHSDALSDCAFGSNVMSGQSQ